MPDAAIMNESLQQEELGRDQEQSLQVMEGRFPDQDFREIGAEAEKEHSDQGRAAGCGNA